MAAPPSRRRPRPVDVREGERPGLLWAFAYFFALLYGYYLLRPLREEMAIRGDVSKLHWLFTATFVAMLVAVPLWSAILAHVPRRRAVPWVYRFFLLHLLAFWALLRADAAPVWVARTFYVWVSVYNLFVVSVFWSLLADLFTSGQGKRLFGFVAGGGSAGALLGSATVAALAGRLGVANVVLLSAALLEVAARCAAALARWAAAGPSAPTPTPRAGDEGRAPVAPAAGREGGARAPDAALGGSAFAGFTAVARSRYLLLVAAQLVLFSVGSTFLYFNLARHLAATLADGAARAALFATIDLVVNVAALATQSLATGRVVAALGLGGALSVVPALGVAGFAVCAAAPGVWTLGGFQTLRRAAHFAVERPAREVLFTVVPAEEKYKAKSFVDTFVYRGADALSGWLHAGLAGLGLGPAALSAAAVPFAAVALLVARALGRRERALERAREGGEERR